MMKQNDKNELKAFSLADNNALLMKKIGKVANGFVSLST